MKYSFYLYGFSRMQRVLAMLASKLLFIVAMYTSNVFTQDRITKYAILLAYGILFSKFLIEQL